MSEILFQSEGVGVAMVSAGEVRLRRTRDLDLIHRIARRLGRAARGRGARRMPRGVVAHAGHRD